MNRYFVFLLIFCTNNVKAYYEVGDSCNNGNGVCKPLRDCPKIIANIRKGLRSHVTCNYFDVMPIVCCPRVKIKFPKKLRSKSEQKCLEYSKFSYENESYYSPGSNQKQYVAVDKCGRTATGFIAGGEPALPREFPHMALIGYKRSPIIWACGGSLISEKHILTAAHCLHHTSRGPARFVRLGEMDYLNDNEDANPVTFHVINRIQHPDYKPSLQYHDVGILIVEENVEFNSYIRPACLPDSNYINNLVIATGWGQTEWGGKPSNVLQKVTLEKFTYKECNQTFNNKYNSKLDRGIDELGQICFGSKEMEQDTCKGDSGGPIQIIHKTIHCSYIIVGVTSFGKACGKHNIPAVYTRIASYKQWIENILYSK